VQLGREGRVAQRALALMGSGDQALGAIARQLAREFPQEFERWEDALAAAADLGERYGIDPDS
jgi:hypothetical protein